MRRVLLVEGSDSRPRREEEKALGGLWRVICESLQVPVFDRVVPIDKGAIKRLSEGQDALDEQLGRLGVGQPGDGLLVVWDLLPPWVEASARSRFEETVAFYRLLDARKKLPAAYSAHVHSRYVDLSGRTPPCVKSSPPCKLGADSIQAVCIEPMFEGLFCDEDVVKQALGLKGQRVELWPSRWKRHNQREAKQLLDEAILAARKHKPMPDIARQLGLDYTRNQEAWAGHFIRWYATNKPQAFAQHNVVTRLRTLLG